MRQYLAALVIAGAALATFSSEASAWICEARSPTGSWGRGWHTTSLAYAQRRALIECAVRTPQRYRCVIRACR